ncbi:MAG TPA: hypothetical protein VFW13_16400 [Phenylobacterium sp.]|nr:hypothetical protein [Phenylobacterium sp.]
MDDPEAMRFASKTIGVPRRPDKAMLQRPLSGVLAIGCMTAAAMAPTAWSKDAGSASLPLEGATFGMTIDAWKALPPPPSAGPTAAPACWTHEAAVIIPGYRLSAEDRRADLTTCAYVSRYGDVVVPHSVRLDATFRADGLRFLFDKGRLADVEFRTSVDAYSDITAMITGRFGPPSRTVSDTVKTSAGRELRLRQTWRVGEGTIVLVDPSPNPTELGVDLALPPPRGL